MNKPRQRLVGKSINEDTTFSGIDEKALTDDSLSNSCTPVASCVVGNDRVERRSQTLRARLERSSYERQKRLEQSVISTFRSLFSPAKH